MNRRTMLRNMLLLGALGAPAGCGPSGPRGGGPEPPAKPAAPTAPAAPESPVTFPFSHPDSGKKHELVMTPLYVQGRPMRFIEHVFDFDRHSHTPRVLAGLRERRDVILLSDDLGLSWPEARQFPFPIGQAFTTAVGSRLVWDETGNRLRRLDAEWNEAPAACPARFAWHGAQGIGQHQQTLMFAEYWTDNAVAEGHVYRSTDDGATWHAVFTVPSHGAAGPKAGQVRHFHTVQPDFCQPGHWYLSSGDDTPECRVWLSKDDGGTWAEVTDKTPEGTDLQNVHRHTSILFFPDRLVWATDGAFRKGAKDASFVEARRGEPLEVKALGKPIANPVRSLVATDQGVLALTENRDNRAVPGFDKTGVEIVLLTPMGAQMHAGLDIDGAGGYTYSLASRQAVEGVFLSFVHHKNGLTNLARWELSEVK